MRVKGMGQEMSQVVEQVQWWEGRWFDPQPRQFIFQNILQQDTEPLIAPPLMWALVWIVTAPDEQVAPFNAVTTTGVKVERVNALSVIKLATGEPYDCRPFVVLHCSEM